MHDAKPVFLVVLLSGGFLLWLVWGWVRLAPSHRLHQLLQIADQELPDRRATPPSTLREQATWLVYARLSRLQGASGLVALGVMIGVFEGQWWRRRDVFAGVRLRSWTLGVLSAALAPGMVGGVLLWPAPWSLVVVASAMTMWSGVTLFLMSRGAPYVA